MQLICICWDHNITYNLISCFQQILIDTFYITGIMQGNGDTVVDKKDLLSDLRIWLNIVCCLFMLSLLFYSSVPDFFTINWIFLVFHFISSVGFSTAPPLTIPYLFPWHLEVVICLLPLFRLLSVDIIPLSVKCTSSKFAFAFPPLWYCQILYL